jgi:hypothetical protein
MRGVASKDKCFPELSALLQSRRGDRPAHQTICSLLYMPLPLSRPRRNALFIGEPYQVLVAPFDQSIPMRLMLVIAIFVMFVAGWIFASGYAVENRLRRKEAREALLDRLHRLIR